MMHLNEVFMDSKTDQRLINALTTHLDHLQAHLDSVRQTEKKN